MASITRTIDVDEAEDLVYDALASQEISKHRWYTKRLIVLRPDAFPVAHLEGFYYLDPASELQEGQDRFESDPVKVFAVEAKEVVTTVYAVAP